jgi:ParB/RepB/Spo0J family partition protein
MPENTRPSKPQFRISPEYASLVSGLSPEEFESLKRSIKMNGLYVPIIVNQDGTILDGHHRFRACQELGIEPKTIVREFSDKLEEQLFVIDCNLIRRQLNKFQRTEMALKLKPLLEEIARRNESLGGKGDRSLTPLGRVDDRIGEQAGVSRDTVRKVEKILENKRISAEIKESVRLGKLSINEAYEIVEQDLEGQSFYQKYCKAADELNKSVAEIDSLPERTIDEKEILRASGQEKSKSEIMKPFRNYLEKMIECFKAYAAFFLWVKYRNKRNDIESVASETLMEIESLGTDDDMQMRILPSQQIEQILYHAVIENKVDINMIKNSEPIQARLELLRREQEASDSF